MCVIPCSVERLGSAFAMRIRAGSAWICCLLRLSQGQPDYRRADVRRHE